MYVIERKANSRKVSIIDNYRDSHLTKKYFDIWKSKRGTIVEKKLIYADAFRERVLYIRYFHKWDEYVEQNRNKEYINIHYKYTLEHTFQDYLLGYITINGRNILNTDVKKNIMKNMLLIIIEITN